jgi:hypothetical protein
LFSTGSFKEFENKNFDPRLAKIGQINSIINLFPDECSLLWASVLLKKRIIVYSENIHELLSFINALPIFAWSRQNWDILRPVVDFNSTIQIDELKVN